MNIIQCSLCKKPFQSIGGKVCVECLTKLDEDFVVVRDYIYDHKKADVDKVAEDTGVSKQHILYLLKQGRLIIEDPSGGSLLSCEICKKPISTGKMCADCKAHLAMTMDKSISTSAGKAAGAPQQQKNGQHFRGSAKIGNR